MATRESPITTTNEHTVRTISTLVFLDFEATGLLGGPNCPRITELCLLAVSRKDLIGGETLPRVTNKLQLCFNPQKPINHIASQMSGLYNDNLENQSAFSVETVNLMNSFLKHLVAPVCLVAHFGHGFDFPLLKAELKKINQSLAEDLLCADSWVGFRSIDGVHILGPSSSAKDSNNINQTGVSVRSRAVANINQSTPEHSAVTPAPPNLKRKSKDNHENSSHKFLKPEASQEAEKVKKRLSFEEQQKNGNSSIGSDSANLEQGEREATNHEENAHELESIKPVLEFSGSLKDEELLAMVTQMENKADQQVTEAEKLSDQSEESKTDQSKTSPLPVPVVCYVTSGTGYHVCSSSPLDKELSAGTCSQQPSGIARKQCQGNDTVKTESEDKLEQTSPDVSKSNETIHPVSVMINTQPAVSKHSGAVSHVSSSSSNTFTTTLTHDPVTSSTVTPVKKLSYKLEEIYRRLYGELPAISHRAEDDCITLVKVVAKTRKIIDWIDRNAILFSDVEPGY